VTPRHRQAVDRILREAITRGDFPSACLLAARDGHPALHAAYGRGELDTVYDLASLTKPLATTAALMLLHAEGRLAPSSRVVKWLPELDHQQARDLRLWHLLTHTSGLPAWRPFYEEVRRLPSSRRRTAVRQRAARTPLARRPGAETLYSDLGFILLDWIVERCAGTRLDRFLDRRLYRPMGLSRTLFVDLHRQRRPDLPFAPTERCPWRGRRLVGEVHDDNCWAMGGVSGHAGLFSTAHEVHLLVSAVVTAYHGGPSPLERDVVREHLRLRPRRSKTRVLGWDTRAGPHSSAGKHFGPRSVGHLGFTGTSVWIDLERATWVVLLTNRVYRGRNPNPMPRLRPRLHDAVLRALGKAGPASRRGRAHSGARLR
jgi:CubicO group peptidase (beta-lactamase class C family)